MAKTMKKGGPGAFISEQDIILFRYLFANKVARLDQMKRDILPDVKIKTLSWRLRRLEKVGLLTGKYEFINGKARKLYSVSKMTFDEFVSNGDEKEKILTSNAPRHDMNLVDIQFRFKQSSKTLQYYPENSLQAWQDEIQDPDLLSISKARCDGAVKLDISGDDYWVGVEYECSERSSSRYEQKLRRLYRDDGPTAVLYICKNAALMRKITSIEKKNFASQGPLLYCTTIDEMMNEEEFIFTNREGVGIKFSVDRVPLEFQSVDDIYRISAEI